MRLITIFIMFCSNLFSQTGQVASPVISNSPNSPYRQLSLLTKEVDELKENLKLIKDASEENKEKMSTLLEEIQALKTANTELQTEINLFKNNTSKENVSLESVKELQENIVSLKNQLSDFQVNYADSSKRIKDLEEEIKTVKEGLNSAALNQSLDALKADYANLEQKLEDTCHFVSDIGTEKYNLLENEIKGLKSISSQVEQKVLAILTDWCKQAEHKINMEHESLEEVKRNLPKTNDWMSSNAFVAFKNENEQHVRELIDFFAEEKIAQFAQKLDEQDQKIHQLSKGTNGNTNLKHSFQKIERKLGEFCKTTCDETIRQVNDRLQNLAQQMQSGFDALSCAKCVQHTITSGESLSSIAQHYRTTPAQIRAVNGLQNSKNLRVGDTILIPKNQ